MTPPTNIQVLFGQYGPAPATTAPPPRPIGPPDLPTHLFDRLGPWAGAHLPWLGAAAIIALVGYVACRNLLASWRHRHHSDGARLVSIAPPPQVDADAGVLWANLSAILTPSWRRRLLYGRAHVVWQYTWMGRQTTISVWVPGSVPPGAVEAAIRAAWPGATTTTTPAAEPIPTAATVAAVGGQLRLSHPQWLPLGTDHDNDPLRSLMSAGAQLRAGEYACVQVLARPASTRRAGRARRAAYRLRQGKPAARTDPGAAVRFALDLFASRPTSRPTAAVAPARDPGIDRDVRAIMDKTAHPLWETAIRYAVATTNTRAGSDPRGRLRGVADALASSFAVYTGRNAISHRVSLPRPVGALAARRLGAGFLTNTPELASLAALPRDVAVPGLERAMAKPMPAPVAVPGGGRGVKVLGDAQIGGHAVGLAVADARYHLHIVGGTGTGKTTALVGMAVDEIRARRGTVVIDPHGDMVLEILDRLPKDVADRVVLFDPDQDNPPTINPLAGTDHDLIVDNLVSIFSSIFTKAWGPRMDDVMRVACLTLLRGPEQGVTLQHIPPLLNSPSFRRDFTLGHKDPAGIGGFWQWYDELTPALRSQVIGPVLARLRSFLLRDFVYKTMRYPKPSFDMGRVLDGGALLVRIPKGVLGEDTTRLLGSMILAQVWQAATARAAIAPDRRRDATLIVDECQNFLTLANSLDSMLAEARKYRLSMVLAHQDLAQFPRELLAATSANARNKLYFTCAPEDARILSRHTAPELDEHDLTHLGAYTAAARLIVDGRQTPAFTLRTRPPKPALGNAEHIRRASDKATAQQPPSPVDDLVIRAAEADRISDGRPTDSGTGQQRRPRHSPRG